jgi:outer membrane protein TolC
MKHNTIRIAGLLILLSLSSLIAQDKLVLTLDGSLELAYKNNPSLQMMEKELAKAKASVTESYSNVLPQINATASLQHAYNIQTNTIPNFMKAMLQPQPGVLPPDLDAIFSAYAGAMPDFISLSFGLENTAVYGATLTQPLFLGGAGYNGIRIAQSAERAAEHSLESTRQDLVFQTVSAFYGCLVSREIVKVQEEALEQSLQNLETVTKKYDAGSASKFDKMRAEVDVANNRPNAISARNNYKISLTRLKVVLGLPMETEIDVTGELVFERDDFAQASLREFQELAAEKRPEVQVISEQKSIMKKGIGIARSAFLPKVFFQTDYSYLGMRNDFDFRQNEMSKGFTSAVSVSIPIFSGLKNNRQYHKAKLDYKIMQDTEKQVTDGVAAEVEAVYNTFIEAKEKFEAANENVELAAETFRLATMMYDEGTNTQLDVFTAQLGLTSARLNYLSSLYEYQLARYALRKATGLLTEII